MIRNNKVIDNFNTDLIVDLIEMPISATEKEYCEFCTKKKV